MSNIPRLVVILVFLGTIAGCTGRMGNINNACDLLERNDSWYEDINSASESWSVPHNTILAFIYQESKFKSNARPPRKRLFGIIPTYRPSSAYGYPQALTSTWSEYRQSTGQLFAERDDFSDAVNFVGWYIDGSRKALGLEPDDVYGHYLAYHEGRGGYSKGSFNNKLWLLGVAAKVEARSDLYAIQLEDCEDELRSQ